MPSDSAKKQHVPGIIGVAVPGRQRSMIRTSLTPAGEIEAKHDGFRIMARRHGNDFTARFPLAVEAVSALSARSFLLDGEAIVTNERGLAVFDLIRHQRHGDDAVLIAFDLIELDGEDLRRTPIELRKRSLAKLMRRASFATSSKRPAA